MAQGSFVVLEGARHEIFMERQSVLEPAWAAIDDFLETVPARQGRVAAISP
jgi:alpha-beta hydrolase superfamily lysophospholipase